MLMNFEHLTKVLEGPGDHEGRLMHKAPKSKSMRRNLHNAGYKEKWFKLVGNLLFYFRLNEQGCVSKEEASGVLVLENVDVHIQGACPGGELFGLALTWRDDVSKSHLFYASSEMIRNTWLHKLRLASYENLSAHLLHLRLQIRRRTGKDPLEHELGRPELFPCSASPSTSHVPLQMPCAQQQPEPQSQFYASTTWYGSSPCLSSSATPRLITQPSLSQPHSLNVSALSCVGGVSSGNSSTSEESIGPRNPSFRAHVHLS
ncbi:pleckstrin homology domain-containing family J member 1 [Hyalella azteca]|uniref:Pleckstrin homology domain-containing family J member 1 n=1 Tax=Hyalella azteca TaxID=294128 RepID=A0A8B7P1J6_HYAAZ|nr:pleckstrin homology domain-containing family J member 1 [Hyalella azteca]